MRAKLEPRYRQNGPDGAFFHVTKEIFIQLSDKIKEFSVEQAIDDLNANGDMDPCVFIHDSDSNIREKALLEAMRSPLFLTYHDGQPFNDNMLRPCPMLENPEKLRKIVADSGAHSTDPMSPETA